MYFNVKFNCVLVYKSSPVKKTKCRNFMTHGNGNQNLTYYFPSPEGHKNFGSKIYSRILNMFLVFTAT